jgi:PKD domain/Galactose oxidase, central domain
LLVAVAAMTLGGLTNGITADVHAVSALPAAIAQATAEVQSAKATLALGQGPAASPTRSSGGPASGLTASSPGTPWTDLGSVNQPSARATPTMVYDVADGYVVYFGGGWDMGASGNDTWTFSGGVWTNITSSLSISPGPREDAAMAYDAADGYVVLFGGYTAATGSPSNGTGNSSSGGSYTINDTWKFVGGAWSNISAGSPTAPSPRFEPQMTYDYTDGYVVLYGGQVLGGGPLSDTWTFSAGLWTNITATAGTPPAGRDFAAFADDPSDHEAVLYGGWNSTAGTIYNDTWTFSGGAWTSVATTTSPGPLRGAVAAYDGATGSVVLFGGGSYGASGPWALQSETWSFSGGAWTNLLLSIASSPPARFAAGFTNTSSDGTLLLADGCLGQGCMSFLDLADSWEYNAAGPYGRPWIQITGSTGPSARATPTLAYDPEDHYVVYFGGGWDGGTSGNETWTFANDTWTNISSTLAVSPTAREGSVMAWDAADGYVVLFGGYASGGPYSSYVFSDTWTFQNGGWSNITSLSPTLPPARFVGAMTYDYTDGYLVLYGGDALRYGADMGPTSDTWTFSAGVWTDVTATAGAPPAGRDFASFADDPSDGYAVLFGGWNSSSGTVYNDTWTFSGGAWTHLTTPVAPMPLRGAMLAYEPVGGYVLLFGGTTYSSPAWPFGLESQTWAFKAGNWTNLTPYITTEPPARYSAGITNISTTGTLVMADGCLGQGCFVNEDLQDTWLYNWTNVNGTVNLSARPASVGAPTTFYVHAIGGNGQYSYSYSGLPTGCASVDTAQLACTPTAGGNFTVSVRLSDSAGRSIVLPLNLSVPGSSSNPTPSVYVAVAASASDLDLGQTTVLSTTPSGGVGGDWTISYQGLPPGCASADTAALSCTPSEAGTFPIVTTVTDVQGVSASANVALSVNRAVQVLETASASAIDLGQAVTLSALASYGSESYSYAWASLPEGCSASSTSASATCTPSATGFWAVSTSVTDSLGQTAAASSIALTVNAPPTVTASAAPGASTSPLSVLLSANAAGGTGPYTIAWNFGDGTAGAGASVSHTFPIGGTYSPRVWYNDSRGGSASSSVTFTVHGGSALSVPPSTRPANLWPAALGGDAGLGLLIGLLAIGAVAGWADRRRRALAEGRALVDRLEASSSEPGAPSGRADPGASDRR